MGWFLQERLGGGTLAVSFPVSFMLFAESLFGYSSCEHLPEFKWSHVRKTLIKNAQRNNLGKLESLTDTPVSKNNDK